MTYAKSIVSELVGTFLLTVIATNFAYQGAILGMNVFLGLAISLQITPGGGANNPAVSFCMLCFGKINFREFIQVVPAQFLGATIGRFCGWIIQNSNMDSEEKHWEQLAMQNYYKEYKGGYGIIMSILATFAFTTAILAIQDKKNSNVPNYLQRILIPLSLWGATAAFQWAFVNPAVDTIAILFQIIMYGAKYTISANPWLFIVAFFIPYIGGACGAFFYKFYHNVLFSHIKSNAQSMQDQEYDQIQQSRISLQHM